MSVIEVEETPSVTRLFAKAAIPRRRGDTLPETAFVRRDITVDRNHLAAYDRVCGFRVRDQLPITYPHLLGFGMSMKLMTHPDFPFALPGLVHIGNRIWQRRELTADERFTVDVNAADLRPHPKGRQFDIVTTLTVDDEAVWTEHSTYLRRGDDDAATTSDSRAERTPATGDDRGQMPPTAVWNVPRDIGRRYGAVSGDRNPIHLYALTARVFGFPRAIAHGMWSKARCLAALEDRLDAVASVDVRFAKPILLPGRVGFAADLAASPVVFSLSKPGGGVSHLHGTVEQ